MSHPAPGDARVSVTPILQKVPLFGQLSPAELDRVAEITRERSYPRNSVILFEDDPGDALYVVAKGQVKVVLIGERSEEHTYELQSPCNLVCRLLLEKKNFTENLRPHRSDIDA